MKNPQTLKVDDLKSNGPELERLELKGREIRRRVGLRARWLAAASVYLFCAVVVGIVFSDFLKPLLAQVPVWREAGASRTTDVPLWEFLQWLSLRALLATPALVLAAAIWATHTFFQRLGAGQWQDSGVQEAGVQDGGVVQLLRRIGGSLLLSAALSVVIVPTLARWLEAQGGFDLTLNPSVMALGVLGGLLIVVADLLGEALRNADVLRAENDSFI
ncbi:hypothetical protein [Deinococcus marmoris]|uniref:hypothetical protein n=1 Tax=Deinococcus marmoris TaxID=249408 RepID=UPI000495E37E|nr:hypothetical protein [Deinococcus marmoris]